MNGPAWPGSITISEWYFKPAASAEDGKRRRLSGSRTVNVEARSSVSGGSTVDVAAAATAVTIATEPSAPAVVNDADRSAGTSDDTILMADYSPQDGDGSQYWDAVDSVVQHARLQSGHSNS